ncbi:GntR family transcriptional regulator [Streptosporangium sandarakinum]
MVEVEWHEGRAKWRQIAEIIEDRIAGGEYGPRTALFEVRLAQEFGVNRLTVRKAIAHLREKGLLETEPGVGSRLAPGVGGDSSAD